MKKVNIKGYLSEYDSNIKKLVKPLRKLILACGVDEGIKWGNLAYSKNGIVCAICICKNYINLEFWHGTALVKRGHKLEGTGKNLRHVKIKTSADIKPSIKKLIKEAVKLNK